MSHDPTSPVESLLRLAGERDQPSSEAMERARAAARQSWQRGRKREESQARDETQRDEAAPALRPRRFAFFGLMAAGIVAAVVAAAWWWPVPPTMEVARVAALEGNVHRASGELISFDTTLRSAEILGTARGRVALTLGDALSLRLDRNTKLRLDGPGHVTLLAGAVYVDSGGLNARTALRIDTPAGEVRHVGTQFQVRVSGDLTRVQVREGRVVLTTREGAADLAAGDLAEATGGRVNLRHGQTTHGADWEWVAATAPAFDIENRPLSELLAWLAREHGWQLRFADAATQSRAQAIRLHGSMSDLDAAGMVARASLITGVPLSLSEGALWVGTHP